MNEDSVTPKQSTVDTAPWAGYTRELRLPVDIWAGTKRTGTKH